MERDQAKHAPFSGCWRLALKISDQIYIYTKTVKGDSVYAPMFIQTLMLGKIKTQLLPLPDHCSSMATKLYYYRASSYLRQIDVAAAVGVDVSTYMRYEKDAEVIPLDKLSVMAELFGVPVTELLDDYHRFLYDGQAKQVLALRKNAKLSRPAFAALLGVHFGTVKRWEAGKARMSHKMWKEIVKTI